MSAALDTLTGLDKLADVARQVVRDTPAPEPSVITIYPSQNELTFQPPHQRDPVAALGTLLVWTHQLTGITGRWTHTDDQQLHVSFAGRGPGGVRIRVYGSIPFDFARGYVALRAGGRESVTPDELYRLALEIRKGQ
ncbi:hypothetical protein ABZ342_32070 [Amycolatopsis sp. NPDC005961]|uniref:hypothetical protein n=1 Tax=Amycolatopsis sp. NPDC005961 TaxID=3156720 RepID=UPI0033E758D7